MFSILSCVLFVFVICRTVYYPSETDLALGALFVECGLAKEHSLLGAMVSQLFHMLGAVVCVVGSVVLPVHIEVPCCIS